MNRISLYLILPLIIFSSCNFKIKDSLFDTQGLYTSSKSLINQGFKKMTDVDILIFERRKNDTIVQLEMNLYLDIIHTKTWKIKMNSIELNNIANFLIKKGCTPYLNPNYNKNSYSFYCIEKPLIMFLLVKP